MRILAPTTVARVLDISVSRLRQLDQEGALPAFRDSIGRRLYRPADVEAYRQAREAKRVEKLSAAKTTAEVSR